MFSNYIDPQLYVSFIITVIMFLPNVTTRRCNTTIAVIIGIVSGPLAFNVTPCHKWKHWYSVAKQPMRV